MHVSCVLVSHICKVGPQAKLHCLWNVSKEGKGVPPPNGVHPNLCAETLNWLKGTADAYPKSPTQSHRTNSEILYLLWRWPQGNSILDFL